MLVKMVTGGGEGDGKIPFSIASTVSAWNRATVVSEDNYIYDDNGTVKVHIDMAFHATTGIANGQYFAGCIPNMTYETPSISSNDFAITVDTMDSTHGNVACIKAKTYIYSGSDFTVQLDYPM